LNFLFYFSNQSTIPEPPSVPLKINPGENHDDLEHIEIKFETNSDEQSTTQKSTINNKHSPNTNNPNSTANSGFSLKNPVSSFRSWVTNKKSSKEDTTPIEQSTYQKIDTSPTPRKSSFESDSKRNRTNSASVTTTTSSNNHQDIQINTSSSTNSTRVKKKSSFSLRSNNPITLLKRTSETTNNTNETESTEQTGTGTGGGAGPFGYLKNLVRGEKQ
jgi:hypothetical protein